MSDIAANVLVQRVRNTHGMILRITKELTDEQLAWRLSQTGPPAIGWHLWHIARWADRLQASFPNDRRAADQKGIWETETLVARWELNADLLGLRQTGVLMERPNASLLPRVGKERLMDYAGRVFSLVDETLAALDAGQFDRPRKSILAIQFVDGAAIPGPGADTTVAGDIAFHLSHANRHLGMMEVLSGMQGLRGSATI